MFSLTVRIWFDDSSDPAWIRFDARSRNPSQPLTATAPLLCGGCGRLPRVPHWHRIPILSNTWQVSERCIDTPNRMPTGLLAASLFVNICALGSTEANVQLGHSSLDLSLVRKGTVEHLANRCSVLQGQSRELV